jgi:hypothetical protein
MKGGASRRQIKTKPAFEKVRLNNSEWAGCTRMGSLIRRAFYTMKNVEDYSVNGALNALCKQIQQADTDNLLGRRGVYLSRHKELLTGFTFSTKQVFESVLRVPVSTTLDRVTGVAQVDIPEFNTELSLYNFRSLPYFRIKGILAGAPDMTYPEDKKEYVKLHEGYCSKSEGIYESEWMNALGVIPAMSFTLKYPLVENPIPDDVTLILSLGIEFGKLAVNGKPDTVKYAGSGKIVRVG